MREHCTSDTRPILWDSLAAAAAAEEDAEAETAALAFLSPRPAALTAGVERLGRQPWQMSFALEQASWGRGEGGRGPRQRQGRGVLSGMLPATGGAAQAGAAPRAGIGVGVWLEPFKVQVQLGHSRMRGPCGPPNSHRKPGLRKGWGRATLWPPCPVGAHEAGALCLRGSGSQAGVAALREVLGVAQGVGVGAGVLAGGPALGALGEGVGRGWRGLEGVGGGWRGLEGVGGGWRGLEGVGGGWRGLGNVKGW
jgi:hypothetical protein